MADSRPGVDGEPGGGAPLRRCPPGTVYFCRGRARSRYRRYSVVSGYLLFSFFIIIIVGVRRVGEGGVAIDPRRRAAECKR